MAETDKHEKVLTAVLQCEICGDFFDDPRLLPCQHTFCMRCLACLEKVHNVKFQCPTCKMSLKGIKISALPKNAMVVNMFQMYQEKSKAKSGAVPFTSSEGPPDLKLASGKQLESGCIANQMKEIDVKTGNAVFPTSDADTQDKKVFTRAFYCDEHKEEKLKLFCVNHNDLICLMCKVVGQHTKCKVKEIDPAFHDVKKNVTRTIEDAQTEKKTLLKEKEKVSNLIAKIGEDKLKRENAVHEKIDELMDLLLEKQNMLLDEINTNAEDKTSNLIKETEKLNDKLKMVEEIIKEEVNDEHISKEEYIKSGTSLVIRFASYKKRRISLKQYKQNNMHELKTGNLKDLISCLTVKCNNDDINNTHENPGDSKIHSMGETSNQQLQQQIQPNQQQLQQFQQYQHQQQQFCVQPQFQSMPELCGTSGMNPYAKPNFTNSNFCRGGANRGSRGNYSNRGNRGGKSNTHGYTHRGRGKNSNIGNRGRNPNTNQQNK